MSGLPSLNDFGGGVLATSTPGVWIAAIRYAIKPYTCLVKRTGAALSIPNATWTSFTWDTEIFDNNAMFAPSSDTVTIQATGIYTLSAYTSFVANATGRRQLALMVNGVFASVTRENSDGATTNHMSLTGTFSLNLGDAVKVNCYQDSTAALNTGTAEIPHFDVVYQSAP